MTVEELGQLFYLRKEIELDKHRLAEANHWLTVAPGPLIPGLTELRGILSEQIAKHSHERDRLETFISGIQDDYTRRLFIMRYAEGKSWMQIVRDQGCYATESCYRKMVYRYLKRAAKTERPGQ